MKSLQDWSWKVDPRETINANQIPHLTKVNVDGGSQDVQAEFLTVKPKKEKHKSKKNVVIPSKHLPQMKIFPTRNRH